MNSSVDNNMSGSDTNIDSHGSNLHATRNSQLQHEEEEYDKFQLFERWLLHNGARFPFLELRAQNVNQSTDDDNDDDAYDQEDDGAEEKKDANSGELSEGGGGVKEVQDEEFDDGSKEMRGVHALTTLPPHSTIISIPKSCLITVEMGQSTPIGRKILLSDIELDAPKHIFLMIYLLWDRKTHGSHSFFAPYYEILPKKLRNMPIFWKEYELEYLRGSYLLHQIKERLEAIQQDYESICTIAPEFAEIATLEEFQWARMIVCSRNFGLLINGHRTSALVPHADMLNHYRPRETRWTYCEESEAFTITTLQCIPRGAEVFDSYGQKCNHRFLLNYGFCVEENVEVDGFCPNEVPLELGMDLILEMEGEGLEVVRSSTGPLTASGTERSGGIGGNSENKVFDRECWEKKLAFWSRGDTTMTTTVNSSTTAATEMGGGVAGGGTGVAGGATTADGFSFHSLASAVATGAGTEASTTTTNEPGVAMSSALSLSWSTDIIKNMSSMNDPSTTMTLTEALMGGGGGGGGGHGIRRGAGIEGGVGTTTIGHPSPRRSIYPVKRVRVCVSNNENTRILFSMLRVLACNSSELDRITFGGRLGTGGYGTSGSAGGGSSSTSYVTQRLFGMPVSAMMGSVSSTSSSSGGGSAASIRTCQDIRYPISLRNERHAMELLLEVTSRALSKYPTSLSQDTADLQDEISYPKFSNKRNAKLQVRGEKEVLHHYALWARTAIHVIDIICHELEMERKSISSSSSVVVRGGNSDDRQLAWSSTLRAAGSTTVAAQNNEELGFDLAIHAMEEDDDCHSTIVRYCSDVLGAVRRDELNRIATINFCSVRSESYRQITGEK